MVALRLSRQRRCCRHLSGHGMPAGEAVWKSKITGGSKPTDEYLAKCGVNATAYDLLYLDGQCKMRSVRPVPLEYPGGPLRSLHMGMHYMNNACETYADEKSRGGAARYNNALLVEDGTVKATKKILPDTEIFTGYREKEHNEGRKSAGKKSSKGVGGGKGGGGSRGGGGGRGGGKPKGRGGVKRGRQAPTKPQRKKKKGR